jgi:cytochrome c oxidase cbb3-type subunit 3/ubiquinol-cytochrome c reductase cytochrome c subunit
VLNSDFMTLMAPQTFRTTVIVGRPDLGMPDWRDQMDSPMTAQQVSDVVAFLMVQKPNAPAGSTQGLQATQGATQQPGHQPKMSGGVR